MIKHFFLIWWLDTLPSDQLLTMVVASPLWQSNNPRYLVQNTSHRIYKDGRYTVRNLSLILCVWSNQWFIFFIYQFLSFASTWPRLSFYSLLLIKHFSHQAIPSTLRFDMTELDLKPCASSSLRNISEVQPFYLIAFEDFSFYSLGWKALSWRCFR